MIEASDFQIDSKTEPGVVAVLVDTADSIIRSGGICSGRSCMNCPFSFYWRSEGIL